MGLLLLLCRSKVMSVPRRPNSSYSFYAYSFYASMLHFKFPALGKFHKFFSAWVITSSKSETSFRINQHERIGWEACPQIISRSGEQEGHRDTKNPAASELQSFWWVTVWVTGTAKLAALLWEAESNLLCGKLSCKSISHCLQYPCSTQYI